MLTCKTGDLLNSSAQALVNTVNCEGYMGKGIAYQFKLQYPKNNEDYIRACRSGELTIGKLHYFEEKGKIIINFPTKNKWREKSHIEYIVQGLDELVTLVNKLALNSIAIPPLGSGNGGLSWLEVKPIIINKFSTLSQKIDVYIYEPSTSYSSQPLIEPKLSTSSLILMEIKSKLTKFDKFRLQKAAYFIDLFSDKEYFNFEKHKYGPYDHSIDIISKNIREFQQYHNTTDTEEARSILYSKIMSESVDNKLKEMSIPISEGCAYVNSISDEHELECLATICFLVQKNYPIAVPDIVTQFKKWSDDKAARFNESEILQGIEKLQKDRIIEDTLVGMALVKKKAT